LAAAIPDQAPEDLRGFTVGITADRRGEEQAVMLRRLGVDVVHAPALRTLIVPEGGEALRAQVASLIADPPDFFVANTGIGVRTLFEKAAEWGLDDDLRLALGRARILARGPKAAGALRLSGLEVWWRAPGEQLAEVTAHLLESGVGGARVVFQRHGDEREPLTAALVAAGALVSEIEVYRWDLPADDAAVRSLVEACCEGSVDAVTFTAAPAVRYFFDVAERSGLAGALTDAFNADVIVGCVGPVCAAAVHVEGVISAVVPEHWRLGSLVRSVGQALGERRRTLRVFAEGGTVELEVRGSLLLVDGREVTLDREERGLARLLAEVPGEGVTEATILERLWRVAPPVEGPRVVEAGVARLKDKLGVAGPAITSPSPGSYRWTAERVTAGVEGADPR
jgi:uroporphyrinogen-III synthase